MKVYGLFMELRHGDCVSELFNSPEDRSASLLDFVETVLDSAGVHTSPTLEDASDDALIGELRDSGHTIHRFEHDVEIPVTTDTPELALTRLLDAIEHELATWAPSA